MDVQQRMEPHHRQNHHLLGRYARFGYSLDLHEHRCSRSKIRL